jgi:hypothetical protein
MPVPYHRLRARYSHHGFIRSAPPQEAPQIKSPHCFFKGPIADGSHVLTADS